MSPPSLKKLGKCCHLIKLIHDEKDWKLAENLTRLDTIQWKKSRKVNFFVIYPDKVTKTVYTQHMPSPNLFFFLTQWFENDQEYVKFLSKQICWRYQPIWNCNPINFLLSIWYADTFTGFWQLDNIYQKQSAIVSWPLQKNLKSLKCIWNKVEISFL